MGNKTVVSFLFRRWYHKTPARKDNLPDPEEIANDIIENLEAGLESFREIMVKLGVK